MYPKPGTFDIERFDSFDAVPGLASEWRQLELASGLPFATWDWATSWWAHFRERHFTLEDRLQLYTFRDPDGALVGVAPLVLTTRLQVSPFPLRQLHFLGADPNVTEVRGVVTTPERRPAIYHALLGAVLTDAASWDWLVLSGLPAGLTDAGLPLDGARIEWSADQPMYALDLPATWDELRQGLSRNLRESLRKCYNRLKRDGRSFRLETCADIAALPDALDHFLALHAARARVPHTVPHADLFHDEPAKPFLFDVCARFAARGALRLFLLRVDEKVVAARIGFSIGDTLYLYYSGYDPAYADYSVMTTLVTEAIKYAIEAGYRHVNLSTGRDVSKTRWRPVELVNREAIVVSPSPRSAIAHGVFRHAKAGLSELPLIRSFSRRGGTSGVVTP